MRFYLSGVDKLEQSKISWQYFRETFEEIAEEFAADFKEQKTKEGLPLYSFAEYSRPGTRRSKNSVIAVTALALDFDGRPMTELEELFMELRADGIGHFWHTTFSHTGDPDKARLRVVVQLSRPVDSAEWARFWVRAVIALKVDKSADSACKDCCRIFYPPAGPKKELYQFHFSSGAGLDVDRVLAMELPPSLDETATVYEQVPENERAPISDEDREHWGARLEHLCRDIERRPYPGKMYDLKRHRVWSLARAAPHILKPQVILERVVEALTKRYQAHGAMHELDGAKAVVIKAINEGQKEPWHPRIADLQEQRDLTNEGLALRMLDQAGKQRLLWVQDAQQWFWFTGTHWTRGAEGARAFVLEVGKSVAGEERTRYAELHTARENLERAEQDEAIDPVDKLIFKARVEQVQAQIEKSNAFVIDVKEGRRTRPSLDCYSAFPASNVRLIDIDANPYLVAFQNGTLDLRTLELRRHRAEDLLTVVIPRRFDPKAKCPRFERFLDEITLGDTRLKNLLLSVAGYSLLGLTTEQKFVILHGNGEDGKTTFLSAIDAALGPLSAKTAANHFMSAQFDEHPTWLMRLYGKRFVWAEEPSHFRQLNEALIKEVTGGGQVVARWMNADESEFHPQFKLWLASNHLPRIDNVDHGIWRRIAVIPFNAKFVSPDSLVADHPGAFPRDNMLKFKLQSEAPGIVALLARYAHTYLQTESIDWSVCKDIVEMYRRQTNPLRDFFLQVCACEDLLREGDHDLEPAFAAHLLSYSGKWEVSRKDLYDAYIDWNKQGKPMRSATFHETVEQRYKVRTLHGERLFQGLRLLTGPERAMRRTGVAAAVN
jgi:putative DNA primase/helicase